MLGDRSEVTSVLPPTVDHYWCISYDATCYPLNRYYFFFLLFYEETASSRMKESRCV